MDYSTIFHSLHPGFFEEESIRSMGRDEVFTELVMDLRAGAPASPPYRGPGGIAFGEYRGEIGPLREAVRRVDEDWAQYFNEGGRFYAATDGDRIVSFCCLTDMGRVGGFRIGGPGCVGTVPECRGRGVGLEMVRRATDTLRRDGYDLSWIHFTHLADWYRRLGYRPVLRWNGEGVLPDGTA